MTLLKKNLAVYGREAFWYVPRRINFFHDSRGGSQKNVPNFPLIYEKFKKKTRIFEKSWLYTAVSHFYKLSKWNGWLYTAVDFG